MLSRDGVETVAPEGAAPGQAAHAEPDTGTRAMLAHRGGHVIGTRGHEPAGSRKQW